MADTESRRAYAYTTRRRTGAAVMCQGERRSARARRNRERNNPLGFAVATARSGSGLEIETLGGASASSAPVLTLCRMGTFASGDSSSSKAAETGIILA